MTDKEVVGVVDQLNCLTISESAGIDGLQCTDTSLEGPVGVVEGVVNRVLRITLDFKVAEIRVCKENPVGFEVLCCMTDEQIPVFTEIPARHQAKTVVGRLVEVVLNQIGVVGRSKRDAREIGPGLETVTERTDGYAIVPHGARRSETGTFTGIERASYVVDVATLGVVIEYATNCQRVTQWRIDHHLDVRVSITFSNCCSTDFDIRVKIIVIRLVGDQTHRACL